MSELERWANKFKYEFEIVIPYNLSEIKSKSKMAYDYLIIGLHFEVIKRGVKLKSFKEISPKETKFSLELIKSKEEIEEYIKFLHIEVKNFKEKYKWGVSEC